jgi:DNA adenine methylase
LDFAAHNINQVGQRPPVKKSLARVRQTLHDTAQRLSKVLIENRDWRACVERYDSAGTFFYLDPPYVSFGRLGRYKAPETEMHVELMERLAAIKGKFLMSHEACDLIRREATEHGFQVREVETKYTLAASKNTTRTTELVIANYMLPA